MSRGRTFLIGLVVIAIGAAVHEFLGGLPPLSRREPLPPPQNGEVIAGRARVVDGDSLEIAGRRIRLFGIDAPESQQTCGDRRGRDYACGADARRALLDAIGGREVTCAATGSVSYDRVVAACRANGRDLGDAMVRAGHALELRHLSRGRYSDAEREARTARRGLWAGSFEEPAEWRREHPR